MSHNYIFNPVLDIYSPHVEIIYWGKRVFNFKLDKKNFKKPSVEEEYDNFFTCLIIYYYIIFSRHSMYAICYMGNLHLKVNCVFNVMVYTHRIINLMQSRIS